MQKKKANNKKIFFKNLYIFLIHYLYLTSIIDYILFNNLL